MRIENKLKGMGIILPDFGASTYYGANYGKMRPFRRMGNLLMLSGHVPDLPRWPAAASRSRRGRGHRRTGLCRCPPDRDQSASITQNLRAYAIQYPLRALVNGRIVARPPRRD
jgi:hypothetical protein